ncbi:MAG: TIR domain-containing protein [Bacteroidota bacterium]
MASKKQSQYDIFISYRHDGGFETAKMVQEKLKSLGYRVFLDFEELRTGKFNEKLYEVIMECKDFVVIMSPGGLDRCQYPDDWLRLEVMHALENKRNIIPIMLRNFTWPDTMPSGMEELKFMNGLSASDEFFDAYIKRLVSYMKSSPSILRKFKRLWVILVVFVTVITSFVFFYSRYESQRQLEQVSNAVIGDMGLKMARLNAELDGVTEASKKWAAFYHLMIMPGDETYKSQEKLSFIQYITYREEQLQHVDYRSPLTDHYLKVLSGSKIPLEDVQAFYSTANHLFFEEVAGYYSSLKSFANMPVQGWSAQTIEMMFLRERMVALNGEVLYYNILELLSDMPEASRQVYNRFSSQLTHFPSTPKMGKEEARSAAEKSMNMYQQALNEYAALTGQANKEVKELEKDVESLALKKQKVDVLKEELATVDLRLSQSKANLLKKCQPVPDDDEWMIWGKMSRLLSAKMNKHALEVLTAFEKKMKSKGENVYVYTKAVKLFIDKNLWHDYDGGMVAIGFENDQPHSCMKPGDIVVKVNGKTCNNLKSMNALRKEFGKNAPVTVLRLTSSGSFETVILTFHENDPRAAYLDLLASDDN